MRYPTAGLLVAASVSIACCVAADGKGPDKTPTNYAVAIASVTLPKAGLSRRDASSKSFAYGPRPEQTIHVDAASWEYRDVSVTLTVTTLPQRFKNVPASVLMSGAKKGLLEPAGQGATLADEASRPVMVDGRPGECLALLVRAGKQRVRARIVAHEGRICQLTAVGTHSDVDTAEVNAALDSFAVTPSSVP